MVAWLLSLLAVAMALYAAGLALDAPRAAALPDGPYGFGTMPAFAGQSALMMLIGGLALVTARRGRLAARAAR